MPKQKPNEQVQQIPLSEIRPFKNHPFKVTDDELMQQTIDSIMQVGVLNPAIIRPAPEGGYEMGNLDDDEAVILMVDSNLQRETISPMERAQAYKMKLEALKHQGKRRDLTSSQVGTKLRTDEIIAQQTGSSRNQVQRFVRLNELVPEIQEKVDSKEPQILSPKLHALANAANHHQAAGAVAEKTAAPERALRKAGLSMNVTINIYGDVHIHCDCCDERGVYDDDLEKSPEAPSAEEAEAAVKALAAFFLPLFSEETNEGGGAHEGI